MAVTELPASLVVLGGGPIGCEFAQVFARFGVDVTVVEMADRLVAVEEPEASEVLEKAFANEGITVLAGASVDSVAHDEGGFTLRVDGKPVRAEKLLVAAGRHANLDFIGLDTVGLPDDLKVVETDERMRAGKQLWAIGDITGKGAFTHVSMYQGAVVVRDVLGEQGPWADYRAVPRVTFTAPEVASVGMSEKVARDAGLDVAVGTGDLGARGWLAKEKGLIKLVADRKRGVLVGGCVVAETGGEILSMLEAAVHAEIPVSDAADDALRVPDLPPRTGARAEGARPVAGMRPLVRKWRMAFTVEIPLQIGGPPMTTEQARLTAIPDTHVPDTEPEPAAPRRHAEGRSAGDFLRRRADVVERPPATWGWRGAMTRWSGGAVQPQRSRAERRHEEERASVQREYDGPRTIVFLNPKGGAAKTTSVLAAGYTFGTVRGGGIVAWDNNETRGTLGIRALRGTHQNTTRELLADLDKFAGADARIGDLATYVRTQGDAHFDVLASDERPGVTGTIRRRTSTTCTGCSSGSTGSSSSTPATTCAPRTGWPPPTPPTCSS